MRERAKRVANQVAKLLSDPRASLLLTHDARAALADASALLLELCERVEKLERSGG